MVEKQDKPNGRIFNIQRYSVQDGPGIRTTVFMKGCPARCPWCSNPESRNTYSEVGHNDSLCNRCGRCLEACKPGAITFLENGLQIDRTSCSNCAECVPACDVGALKLFGAVRTVDEVVEVVLKDTRYYRNSGGGVTVSGGEALMQVDFVAKLLKACRELGIHTTLDTSGCIGQGAVERGVEHADLVLYDLKHMDTSAHARFVGMPNGLILENARLIASKRVPIIIRIPLIPGINDSDENLKASARFAASLSTVREIDLLPYHRFGVNKYRMLDLNYGLAHVSPPDNARLDQLIKMISDESGVPVQVGG